MDQRIHPLNTNTAGRGQTRSNAEMNRRAAQGAPSNAGQTGRTIGSRSDYGITRTPSALHVGDTIRGEITDLRNNEIAITLEDNTTIRAQISDSSSFSIGQTGSFRLTQIAGTTIYLENVSISYSDSELAMIMKALEEAGLPMTDHNEAAVKALMDNMLPINRTSIQNLMQQSYDFKTEDMNTLAVMNRLMMKMNQEMVTQFSNYRNDNYQLLEQLQNFSKDIPSLLHALADNSPAESVAVFGKELLSIGLMNQDSTDIPTPPTISALPEEVTKDLMNMLSNAPLTEDTITQLENQTLSLQDAVTLLRDAAADGTLTLPEDISPEEFAHQLNHLIEVLEPASENTSVITEDFIKNIISLQPENRQAENDDAATETTEATKKNEPATEEQNTSPKEPQESDAKSSQAKPSNPFFAAGKFFQSISDSAKNTFSTTFQALRTPPKETVPEQAPATETSNESLNVITDMYARYSHEHDLLSSYLSSQERNELLNYMQNMPISKSMLLKISSGEATTKDVLAVLHNTISMSDSELVKELFQTEAFEKLFTKLLQSNWTLTPKDLTTEHIGNFYQKMQEQIGSFRSLIESSLSGSDSESLGHSAKNMEDNINFMKMLNENFSYFQLPLKLSNQDAHGDLYVYTRKEQLRNHPDKNSVLLHLELDHLGKIDIRIDRNQNDVLTNFSLNDEESVGLFRVNQEMLKTALGLLGYRCQIQIGKKEAPSPTMDDFINTKVNTHATTEMKRFSFDIRA